MGDLKKSPSFSLPGLSLGPPHSYILVVVSRPQQRLDLDRLVVFEVRPEKVEPITMLGLKQPEKVALEEVNRVLAHAAVKGTLPAFSNEMAIPEERESSTESSRLQLLFTHLSRFILSFVVIPKQMIWYCWQTSKIVTHMKWSDALNITHPIHGVHVLAMTSAAHNPSS